MTPRVSVVTPFLNAERFLPEAVDSVFAQAYPDWELLLVDDGSSDRSTELARHYATCAPARVRYLEHPGHQNRGISASRNLGIRHARGAYIAFLDADDVWPPTKLEQQVPILDAHPEVDLVYGTALVWYSWNGDSHEATRDYVPEMGMPLEQVTPALLLLTRTLRREALSPSPSNILVRRAAILGAGLFEEQFRGMHEDQAFLAKLCLRSRMFVSGNCWQKYRQHAESCMASATAKGHRRAARERYLKWLRVYLAEQGRRDSEVWKIVEEQLRPYRLRHRLRSRGRQAVRAARRSALDVARQVLPQPFRAWLRGWSSIIRGAPPPGRVRFGSFRRLTPISRPFGKDRAGVPIDRYYVERFFGAHAADIAGRVLEVRDATYTCRFGGGRVTKSDVAADLVDATQISSATFDCIILDQVLLCIEDMQSVVRTVHRILRPGGVALVAVPGISPTARFDIDGWGDYRRFTTLSARRLFESVFPTELVEVEAHGNVLAAVACLHGLSSNELRPEELNHADPDYQLLITVRAVKGAVP
jgi:glycosyltransferase involved in cell wall biosynthesis